MRGTPVGASFSLELSFFLIFGQRECSAISYKTESSSAAKMTVNSGIRKILPNSDICGFEFDPCGYSMNSIEGAALSTIHVTPEDGFSYASFEAVGYYLKQTSLGSLVERCWHVSSQTSFVLLCMRMLLASYCKHICSLDVKGYSLAEWIPEEFATGIHKKLDLVNSEEMLPLELCCRSNLSQVDLVTTRSYLNFSCKMRQSCTSL
ncbi:hypothetical protein K7X08_031477 [Anisodus acutangulus]|uniref:S-adenosylmethionine decarboxylase proenzyme n=1 Tax=Anisodus acutangulus TaxID=402998 RepID=A0A9Q1ML54_9SOLA|nr:hypothetical protein K7X08_031477 [Anisodus acutangulus]